MDAAVERTGMYSQGELRSKRGCPGVQRVQKTYVDQLLYSLVSMHDKPMLFNIDFIHRHNHTSLC